MCPGSLREAAIRYYYYSGTILDIYASIYDILDRFCSYAACYCSHERCSAGCRVRVNFSPTVDLVLERKKTNSCLSMRVFSSSGVRAEFLASSMSICFLFPVCLIAWCASSARTKSTGNDGAMSARTNVHERLRARLPRRVLHSGFFFDQQNRFPLPTRRVILHKFPQT